MTTDWEIFEYRAIEEHIRKYNHDKIWHNSCIPEEELYEAGIINEWNKTRMDRIRRRRENKGQVFKYIDYGIDFLSKDESNNYHIGQVKYYNSRKVRAEDIGTFLVMHNVVGTTSYLYTSGSLQINLKEMMKAFKYNKINHHKITLNNSQESQELSIIERRYYQKEAVKICVEEPGRKIIEMACGTGKTVIAADVLYTIKPKIAICVAPLLISVRNLYDRFQIQENNYKHVIVNCEGTTDSEEIEELFNSGEDIIIYTTFKSMEDVIEKFIINDDDKYLIVDEVHNAHQREKLCNLFKRFKSALFLTATMPEDLNYTLDAKCVYKYTVSQAIEDKYICDYEVFLPFYEDIEEITVMSQAYFLATGMLNQGTRRCIVYLTSCAECDEYAEYFKKAFEEYHGCSLWCNKLDSSITSSKRRDEILSEFQYNTEYDKYILLSVRILDEAIDIPACDSEYIVNVSDYSSEIRTVQRLMRGARLDKNNPNKKNCLYIWATDWNKTINMLSLLREMDPKFYMKIRNSSINYDLQKVNKNKIIEKDKELINFTKVKCMTLNERFIIRFEEWKKFMDDNNKHPRGRSKDENEKSLGLWIGTMRKHYKKGTLSAERIATLESDSRWLWEIEKNTFSESFEIWKKFMDDNNKQPRKHSKDENEKSLGGWMNKMRQDYKNEKLSAERIATLESDSRWLWSAK